MTTSKALNGLTPSRIRGGASNSKATNEYPIASGLAQSIFTGDIVVNNAGNIEVLLSTTQKAVGVFMGCQYVENGEQKFSRFWPGTVSATDIKFFVITDPDQTYYIQASLTVSAAELLIVKNYNVTVSSTASSGNTVTGQSSYFLDGASGVESSAAVRAIGRAKFPDEGSDDAKPILEVWLNHHRDRFVTATASTA